MESRDGVGVGRSAATLIIAAVLVCAAAQQAKSLLAPLAAALFIIGVVWPAQRWLQSLMPKLAALAITIVFTATVCLAFASLAVWAFGRVGQFLVADAARYQAFFEQAMTWLDSHGRLTTRLRLSNNEARALDSMGHRWWRLAGMDEARARRRLYRLGEERYRDRLLLAWARAGASVDPAPWVELARLPQRFTPPKFPLRAADFIARGVAEGPALGHVLTLAEDAWLAADFPLEPAVLASLADQAVARLTRDPKP